MCHCHYSSVCMTCNKKWYCEREFCKTQRSGSVRTVIPLPNIERNRFTASDWSEQEEDLRLIGHSLRKGLVCVLLFSVKSAGSDRLYKLDS